MHEVTRCSSQFTLLTPQSLVDDQAGEEEQVGIPELDRAVVARACTIEARTHTRCNVSYGMGHLLVSLGVSCEQVKLVAHCQQIA
jgi:hypothetical protein